MADHNEPELRGHAYDGIEEYDNPMPGWWVWGFILSVVFAFPYWSWYHLTEGRGIYAEFEKDWESFQGSLPAFEEDRDSLQAYLDDEVVLRLGKSLFAGICASCHGADGGGGVGPNLTDEHYLNVKAIEDLPGFIRAGNDKGMPANGSLPNPSARNVVAAAVYAASLRGTAPLSPKEPQGEVIPPWR